MPHWRQGTGPPEQFQGAFVKSLGPHFHVEAFHRLQVVVEGVGQGVQNAPERRLLSPEIGDQDLDACGRQG